MPVSAAVTNSWENYINGRILDIMFDAMQKQAQVYICPTYICTFKVLYLTAIDHNRCLLSHIYSMVLCYILFHMIEIH